MPLWRRRRRRATPAEKESKWPELLGRLLQSGDDLMVVIGPEDGGSVCTDWVGAVVSISGRSAEFPALVDAVADGLFHPGCRHLLKPYRPPEGEAEAKFCTKWATAAMRRRRENGKPSNGGPDHAPVDYREEFERLYARAQHEEQTGAPDKALYYCQTALVLLRKHDVFGADQPGVERVLKARIQTILRAHAPDARQP